MASNTEYRYAAFVSYSQAASGQLATALQHSLERFATAWYRPRSLRVFRDYTSLSASHDLTASIVAALAASEWLVLLASPEAAESTWVNRELDWWRTNRSPQQVIIALTGGRLQWNEALGDWDPTTTALPPAARGMFTAAPLWVDLRSVSSSERLDRANPDLMQCVAKIAAPMRGVGPDELVGEHITLHRRARRQRVGAVIALCLLLALSSVAATVAFVQRRTAVNQARIASARALASTAVANLDQRLDLAQLLAAEAYRLDPAPQSAAALFQAVTSSPHLVRYLPVGAEVTGVKASTDGKVVVVGTADGRVLRWSLSPLAQQQVARLRSPIRHVSIDAHGTTIAADDGANAMAWSAANGARPLQIPQGDENPMAAVSPSGAHVVVHSTTATSKFPASDGHLTVIATAGGARRSVPATAPASWSEMTVATEREMVLFDSAYGFWQRWNLPALKLSGEGTVGFGVHNSAAAISPSGRLMTYTNGADWLPFWRTQQPTASVTDHELQSSSVGPRPTALAISPDDKYAATASNGVIYVAKIQPVGHRRGAAVALPGNESINAGALAFAGDTRHLIAGTGSSVAVWDLDQLSRISRRMEASVYTPCGGCAPVSLAVNRDGTTVAVPNDYSTQLGVYRFDRRGPLRTVAFAEGGGAAWTPDGRLVVRAAADAVRADDTLISVPVTGEASGTKAIGASADGARVVVVDSANTVETRRADDGRLLQSQRVGSSDDDDSPDAQTAAVSQDGSWAAVITGGGVEVVSTSTGKQRVLAASDQQARVASGGPTLAAAHVAFAGNTLAVQRSERRFVDLYDPQNGRRLRTITNDPETTGPFALNAQDTLFAQYRNDGTVVIRDSQAGAKVGAINVYPPAIGLKVSLAFSGDGNTLVTAIEGASDTGFPGQLQSWTASPAQWLTEACATAGRSLTADEWRQYVGTTPPTNLDCLRPR